MFKAYTEIVATQNKSPSKELEYIASLPWAVLYRMLNGQINVFPNELNFDGERV